jgi:hypothetical protein
VVDRVGLENRSTRKGTVGSNPTLSAIFLFKIKGLWLISALVPTLVPTVELGLWWPAVDAEEQGFPGTSSLMLNSRASPAARRL